MIKIILFWTMLFPSFAFAGSLEESNKTLVRGFYEMAFLDHKPREAAEKYLAADYIQHNPNVATGRKPFIDYFVPFFKEHPQARSDIKRIAGDGNLVFLHVHSRTNEKELGRAIVDIFRVEGDKIVEHWDVMQPVPAKIVHSNSMF